MIVYSTGVNARTSIRKKGWSTKGRPCISKGRYDRGGRNTSTVIACSRTAGILSFSCQSGSFKRPDFLQFLSQHLIPDIVHEKRRLKQDYLSQSHTLTTQWDKDYDARMRQHHYKDVTCLVMDNASIHKGDIVVLHIY